LNQDLTGTACEVFLLGLQWAVEWLQVFGANGI